MIADVVQEEGLDFSFARPGGAAIVAAGKKFVVRYVPYVGDQGKGLTAAEIVDYRVNGLGIGLVWESTAGRMFDGYPAGKLDALISETSRLALGIPPIPIYFACDVDTQPSMLAYVDDYLRGAASVLTPERTGVYGEWEVIDHCYRAATADWYWQTLAWSGGKVHPQNHLYQWLNTQTLNGGEVDYTRSYQTDSGLWKVDDDMAEDDLVIATWCTNQEIRDLRDGIISRPEAITAARSRISDVFTATEPMGLADTLYSHVLAAPPPTGLIPHHHDSGLTGGAIPE